MHIFCRTIKNIVIDALRYNLLSLRGFWVAIDPLAFARLCKSAYFEKNSNTRVQTVPIAIPLTEAEKWHGGGWQWKESRAKVVRGANRDRAEANRGRFAAIALPRSYRPVAPRLHLACPTYIPIYIYVYLLPTYLPVLRRALPCPAAIAFFCIAFFPALYFSSLFPPPSFSLDATDARKRAIILIPSAVSNFDISPSSDCSGTFT